jgi:hypothetical protein
MANRVTADDWLHRKILAEAMADLVPTDPKASPPEVLHGLFRRTARTLGNPDPYSLEKKRWREELLANAESIRKRVEDAQDPLLQALKLSIASNELDDELREGFTLKGLLEGLDRLSLDADQVEDFRQRIVGLASLLFVHDTVGELFFDRLLIEQILRVAASGCAVTSVVRTSAVLGDAAREDAEALGLDAVATVVDPGLDCLGLPISECSAEFRQTFKEAKLIIGKGQAVYQTLEAEGRTPDGVEKDIWFLFRVKCPVMARKLAAQIGDLLLERN